MTNSPLDRLKRVARAIIPYDSRLFQRLYKVYIRLESASRLRRKTIENLHIQVHATEHCNLNCKGCNVFCPIIDEEFLDVDEYERDLTRLAQLTGGRIGILTLSGGEPMLHPRLDELMDIGRRIFPRDKIQIITNGTLLAKAGEPFWTACRRNRVTVSLTYYPIKLDMDRIKALVAEYGVDFSYQDDTDVRDKTMYMCPMDPEGKQDIQTNYQLCFMANFCITMEHGRIYTCPIIPHIRYFNEYYDQNFQVCPADYRDIYRVENFDEVLDFLCRPAPFCRYCNKKGRISGIEWAVSKKDRSEWM